MLQQRSSLIDLAGLLIPRTGYHPHPTIEDRSAWNALPAPVAAAHLQRVEAYLGFDYPSLPATLFFHYSRIGNRENY